jgi:hypothetical protein
MANSTRKFCLAWIASAAILASPGSAQNPAITSPKDKETQIQFSNVTAAAGIKFTHLRGNDGIPTNLEIFGPGVCVADYDRDGYQDIYFVNGRDLHNRGIPARNSLYRNNGNFTFADVTDQAGVPGTGYGLGCVWGDYDNDGYPDLFVTQFGRNVLYHNNGDGTFTDVTDKAGVAGLDFGTQFHSGATFFDYDRDGYLDLYVGGYVDLGPDAPRYCTVGGVKTSCPPSAYKGTADILYHNNGDGTFTNVTKAAKIFQPHGKNLAVGAADYDNDGWPDLFVANDYAMAAMCISFGDYLNDGNLDLFITDFQQNSDHLWRNDGKGSFDEVTEQSGVTLPTKGVLGFGGGFFDYDNDGWLDLFVANGHVYPEVEQASPDVKFKQINTLLHNEGNGKFVEKTKSAGSGFETPYVGRGVAFADFNNDGFLDVVVGNNGDPPLLLRNSGANGNHFLNLKLVGHKSNRDAMGARVRVVAGGLSQIREIYAGGSYLSQSDLRANFGLGKITKVDRIEINWPSGKKQIFEGVEADKFYQIDENTDGIALQRFAPHSTAVKKEVKP